LESLLPEKPLTSACAAIDDIMSRVEIKRFTWAAGNRGTKVIEKAFGGYDAVRSAS
jgi:hypothetical protein